MKIAFLGVRVPGHLNPMTTLARKLCDRAELDMKLLVGRRNQLAVRHPFMGPRIVPVKSATVAGGDESHYGALTLHYRNEGRFKVIRWSAHNLSYALVSSIASLAQEPCMVCHQAWQITGSSAGSRSAAFTKNSERRNEKRLDVSLPASGLICLALGRKFTEMEMS